MASMKTYVRKREIKDLLPLKDNDPPQASVNAGVVWAPTTPDKPVHNPTQQEQVHDVRISNVNQQDEGGCTFREEDIETGGSSSAVDEVKVPTDVPCSSEQLEFEDIEQRGSKGTKLKQTKKLKVKRKKHRPKVVQEDCPVKVNPVTPEQVPPKPVRKYANRMAKTRVKRKKKDSNSEDKPSNETNRGSYDDQDVENHANTIRRKLNFDSEGQAPAEYVEPKKWGAESNPWRTFANSRSGRVMKDMIGNPTASVTFHCDHFLPMQLSRRQMLVRNWKQLARKPKLQTVDSQMVNADMIIVKNDREDTQWTKKYRETTQIAIWNQRSTHGQDLKFYKRKRKRKTVQEKKYDVLMQDSSRTPESIKLYNLLQGLKNPMQSNIASTLHPLESISNIGFTALLGVSQEKNIGHSISYTSIINYSQELEPHCTNLMSQAIVPYAHRTQYSFFQQQEDIRAETSNALVRYGRQFDEIKKQRPRAKVDLDEYSNQMWNLISAKQGDDAKCEADMDKEKQWEEERQLFCGRVDSFISRMHLIQGDRRFSQWKGSVLDSIVGVFLTQNVSDTLSSSAYMSLSSKFPLSDDDAECNAEGIMQDGSLSPSIDTETKMERTNNSFINSNRVNGNNFSDKERDSKGFDWDSLRKEAYENGYRLNKTVENRDSLDWEAVRCADVKEISEAIQERGQNNILAARIKDFLSRIFRDHGSLHLEWLRDVPPDKAKDYLLSIRGLGLKSVECVRLLALNQLAFPVDTNVARICVRLGWVPIQPLPGDIHLHLLELYPVMEHIQKYLWPRLCKLDQRTLYELHYQMITFGKVFCTKKNPNCSSCPMRAECRHFASASASATLALPGPSEKCSNGSVTLNADKNGQKLITLPLSQNEGSNYSGRITCNFEPIVEEPTSMSEPECMEPLDMDIEDAFCEDSDDIPEININLEEFGMNLENCMKVNMDLQDEEMKRALVPISREAASIPAPKLKCVSRLRTEHYVYELPDSHPLLEELDPREPDDPCPYLLNIWTPGETAQSTEPPETSCNFRDGKLCDNNACFRCSSKQEEQAQIIRGTLLIPCRTALRGRFPLNGTYFQVNEVFADDETSHSPIHVLRESIWNLPRRTVYVGSGTTAMFRGQSVEKIRMCFARGFVCTRGFDRRTRAPRPLCGRLHHSVSKAQNSQRRPVKEAKKPMKKRQGRI